MHTTNAVAPMKLHVFWVFQAAVSMEAIKIKCVRRKTTEFGEEMLQFMGSISSILQLAKASVLCPIRIFGDRWPRLVIGLPD
jgi:hypothetical protein